MEDQPIRPARDEKEVDLGLLFAIFIEIARKLVSAFRRMMQTLVGFFIWILLFIRRRVWFLLAGMLIGLIPGTYIYFTKGAQYCSYMTVKVNFGSASNLYNKLDYLNALMQSKENQRLASLFRISEAEAANLVKIEIRPIDDEVQSLKLYKQFFYNPEDYKRVVREGELMLVRDSTWSEMLKFNQFKNKLGPLDYPLQQLRLVSRSPYGYAAIQKGLIDAVDGNSVLHQHQQLFDTLHRQQTAVIRNALVQSDSLMKAYNKGIASGLRTTAGSTLTLSEKQAKNPETEVFDQAIKLNNELGRLHKEDADNQGILDVYADFNDRGTYVSPFKESFLSYSLWCLLGSFIILLLVEAYITIDAMEKKKQHA